MRTDDDANGTGDDLGPTDPAADFTEPAPESDLPKPEEELPSVPDPPSPPETEGDVPGDLLKAFWTTVLVFNVALLALSVGALMVAFDVHRSLGAGIFVVGLVSLARGYLKYRDLQDRDWSESEESG